jgi:Flp pilus assembly protein TadD
VEINPNGVLAHKNLAVLFSRQGEVDQAIAHLQKAVEISPNDLGAINDLAWLLATCPREDLRDGARAVELAERACQATGHKVPELMDTLAAAYAEAGRFSQAVATAEKSLSLIQPDQESVAERIRQRLERYQAGKPYHTQH